eukprot:CAMPEP_0181209454 /NCGR_PEP_ID=MMETSP1096-20121128/22678_1 /TAXON_ID=156174 ORGANISM="Chrysochromulina ericina, Strain CCMP281" /NCGR_SAMPLE_ID=MMETSP1096 /ASSEMBLY_ACC=CAM_ASM_000453 /LENGTH=90 /DNA_ID=CAMNT_0023300623 /DNA_START=191 /DNA_END=463 /DNA_ORIENTATION=+
MHEMERERAAPLVVVRRASWVWITQRRSQTSAQLGGLNAAMRFVLNVWISTDQALCIDAPLSRGNGGNLAHGPGESRQLPCGMATVGVEQ